MLPIHPIDLERITSRVGFTVWQLQQLEQTVQNYHVFVNKLSPEVARSEAEKMFEKAEGQTLGQLYRELSKTGEPAALLPRLESLIKERNWLVHHSRLEDRTQLYSPEKLLALSKRIEAIADEA